MVGAFFLGTARMRKRQLETLATAAVSAILHFDFPSRIFLEFLIHFLLMWGDDDKGSGGWHDMLYLFIHETLSLGVKILFFYSFFTFF